MTIKPLLIASTILLVGCGQSNSAELISDFMKESCAEAETMSVTSTIGVWDNSISITCTGSIERPGTHNKGSLNTGAGYSRDCHYDPENPTVECLP